MRPITIKDIASHLQLSVSTVSRALADDQRIRRETRERVAAAAERLGYRRNHWAASLRKGRTGTIGVIVSEMTSPFSPKVIRGIQSVMHPLGIQLLVADSNGDPEQERRNISLMERSCVDGLIISICDWRRAEAQLRGFRLRGTPVVFYDRTPRIPDADQVGVNDYDTAFFLLDRLLHSGRRRIAHIKGPDSIYNYSELRRAYEDSLHKFRIPYDERIVIASDVSIEGGHRAAEQLLESGAEFDAVFASSEIVAIGAMNRLRDHGVKIPQEAAIAGFYGSELSRLSHPQLTSIELPLEEMGVRAAQIIVDRINHADLPPQKVVLDAKIRIRGSSHEGM